MTPEQIYLYMQRDDGDDGESIESMKAKAAHARAKEAEWAAEKT